MSSSLSNPDHLFDSEEFLKEILAYLPVRNDDIDWIFEEDFDGDRICKILESIDYRLFVKADIARRRTVSLAAEKAIMELMDNEDPYLENVEQELKKSLFWLSGYSRKLRVLTRLQ